MFSWHKISKKPLIIAHRGSSATAPENTMAAFKKAIEDKAQAIEVDVRLTRDMRSSSFTIPDLNGLRMDAGR
ncbi:MAG: glycerophosphodiester phosphodiesterase [Bacteroidetes bacterium]|nr:glycerophosphodiester phosphodiesterase [Bacteroidota bacterium]